MLSPDVVEGWCSHLMWGRLVLSPDVVEVGDLMWWRLVLSSDVVEGWCSHLMWGRLVLSPDVVEIGALT